MAANPQLQGLLDELPDRPGVYLLKDSRGRILYVGKAKSLRSRVRSYFSPGSTDDRRLLPYLRERVRDIDTVVVSNEKEAFLLENSLIKQHRPRYNVRLIDDKTYLSLRLDRRHPFPRYTTVRRPRADGSRYFGPYSSAGAVRSTLKLIYRTFGIRSCTDAMFSNRIRPCLYHQIGQCLAPCVGYVEQSEYQAALERSELLLEGRSKELLATMRDEMHALADAEKFEQAARVRDRLRAVERTLERQDVQPGRDQDFDVVGHVSLDSQHAYVWLIVRDGRIVDTTTVRSVDPAARPSADVLTAVLTRVYENRPIPPVILCGEVPAEQAVLEQILTEARAGRVTIQIPQRGTRRRLLGLADSNARASLELQARRGQRDRRLLAAVASLLRLPRPPYRLECFDISNLGGTLTVGSMVAAIEGVPTPAEYRRYRIKTIEGGDDYAAMAELLRRRLQRALADDKLPDALLIDGGPGQLRVAVATATELGLGELPVIAISKGPRRNAGLELIHLAGADSPLQLEKSDERLHFLQRIRDEAHRFAIGYNRQLRSHRDRSSTLTTVPGLGPKRLRHLLTRFGSLQGVQQATEVELRSTAGMNASVAARLFAHLHPEPTEVGKISTED